MADSLGSASYGTSGRGYGPGEICKDSGFTTAVQACITQANCNEKNAKEVLCFGGFVGSDLPTASVAAYSSAGASAWHAAASSAANVPGGTGVNAAPGSGAAPSGTGNGGGKGSAASLALPVGMALGAVVGTILVFV